MVLYHLHGYPTRMRRQMQTCTVITAKASSLHMSVSPLHFPCLRVLFLLDDVKPRLIPASAISPCVTVSPRWLPSQGHNPKKNMQSHTTRCNSFTALESLQPRSHHSGPEWSYGPLGAMSASGSDLHDAMQHHYTTQGRQCGICGRRVLGSAWHLSRHVATRHTGASHVLVR